MNYLNSLLLFLLLTMTPVASAQTDPQPRSCAHTMAQHLPQTDVFIATRTDATYLDQLDRLFAQITSALPEATTQTITLRQLINDLVAPEIGLDVTAIVDTWLGNCIAIGIKQVEYLLDDDPANDAETTFYLAAEIENQSLATLSLSALGLVNEAMSEERESFTIYTNPAEQTTITLSDEMALVSIGETDPLLNVEAPLGERSTFIDALAELPVNPYDLIVYDTTSSFLRWFGADPAIEEILTAVVLNPETLVSGAIGVRFTDTDTLVADFAQLRTIETMTSDPAIDPTFTRYFPADASATVQATNIQTLLNTAAGLIASISASDTPEDILAQFETLSSLILGLDLQNDILSLAQGDYGAFVYAPVIPEDGNLENLPLEYGLLFEITSRERGQALVDNVTNSIVEVFDETRTYKETFTGARYTVEASVLQIEADSFYFGVTDQFLFLATEPALQRLVEETTGLSQTMFYQQANENFLTEPNVAVVLNGAELTDEAINIASISLSDSANNSLLIRLVIELAAQTG